MEKERKIITFTVDMIELIHEFKDENFINTFTGAVVELVRRGLEYTKEKDL